jgi:hypothetical protein
MSTNTQYHDAQHTLGYRRDKHPAPYEVRLTEYTWEHLALTVNGGIIKVFKGECAVYDAERYAQDKFGVWFPTL